MSRRRSPLGPVVALDIDGTMGEYHAHFWNFARQWTGRDIPVPEFDEYQKVSFSKALGLGQANYRACKLAYRQGGMKRSMRPVDGARELTKGLRDAGAEIWICTTRPYLRLDNIDPDTRHWARRNGIVYDYMIYGEKKYQDLLTQVPRRRIIGVLDDLPEQIEWAVKLDLDPILRRGDHNRWYTNQYGPHEDGHLPAPPFTAVHDLHTALGIFRARIARWKKENL